MSDASPSSLLGALLDSWTRNNTILINLFRAIPDDALTVRPMANSPSVAELFAHIHYVRSVFVLEDAPEFSKRLPDEEWVAEPDRARLEQLLNNSAKAVADAVRNKVETTREMNLHYDHPILMLQHMVWHEGYHHGQIKLTLKLAGRPLNDAAIGRMTWGVWMRKTN